MLGTVNTARLCACRVDGDDADGGLSAERRHIEKDVPLFLYAAPKC